MIDPSHVVVTTFNKEQEAVYGAKFVETFHRFWPKHVYLAVIRDEDFLRDAEWARWRLLADCPYLRGAKHPMWDALKFAWKVFAMSRRELPASPWRIWIDADVITTREVDSEALAKFCPADKLLGFLGRPGYHYTETGFLAWRTEHPVPRAMLQRFRDYYLTGEVFRDPKGWGDGLVFDRVRKDFQSWQSGFYSYSDEVTADLCHVWPHTVLGSYMEHYKGVQRKATVYGRPA